jgi:ABC-2 type transport system permease protein
MSQLRVHWIAFKTTLQTRFEYRADLVLGLLGALGWQAAGLSTFWVLLHASGGQLAGWSPYEIGLIFGLTAMIQGTSELFANHIWWTPIYVIRGQFDRLLCYPVRPLPFFLISCPELHAFGNIGGGLAMFSVCAVKLGFSPLAWLALPWWVACGSLIHTSILVLAGSAVLKIKGNSFQFLWLTNALLGSSRYPLGVYPGKVQFLLLVIVPFSTANFLPASTLTSRLSWVQGLGAPALAAVVSASIAWMVWDRAFLGYESTGS